LVVGAASGSGLAPGEEIESEVPPATDLMHRASEDVRRIGTLLVAWWINQIGEEAFLGHDALALSHFDLDLLTPLEGDAVRRLLGDDALRLPQLDPWGRPYEIRVGLPTAESLGGVAVRCAGSDGEPDGGTYAVGPVARHDSAADLVWANGYFVRWPPP
jgi:hypothetical protein